MAVRLPLGTTQLIVASAERSLTLISYYTECAATFFAANKGKSYRFLLRVNHTMYNNLLNKYTMVL